MEVAQKFVQDADVVVAQMDASANDAVGIEPEGFPTILFYPKTNKRGIEYAAENHLSENASSTFPLPPSQV